MPLRASAAVRVILPRSIRYRLALILVLPTTALVVLAGIGTAAEGGQAGAASDARRQVAVVVDTEGFVAELQRERGLTAGLLGGGSGFVTQLTEQRAATDRTRAALDRELAGAAGLPAPVAVQAALGKLGPLSQLRGQADARTVSRADAFAFYTAAVDSLHDAAFTDLGRASDSELRADLTTLRALGDAAEATALERGKLNGVLAAQAFSGGDYPDLLQYLTERADALTAAGRSAQPHQQAALDGALRSPAATRVASVEQQALASYRSVQLPFRAPDWWSSASALVDALHQVQMSVAHDTEARATVLADQARLRLGLDLLLAALALAAAFGLWWAASRSITRPLRRLTEEAAELADLALPAAVARIKDAEAGSFGAADGDPTRPSELGSQLAARGDEIAQVATALDRVSATALRLAVEQAVLQRNGTAALANLGQRNRELVNRQLSFLSALEGAEEDPGQLANLFELDHLSTRMRRNAESLLILAGEHSPRRWDQPIGMGDVLRSALGEVSDYRRVVLRQVQETLVDGGAVAELAHLLAELIDNALAASSPDADVEVYASHRGTDYLIAVVDHGHGLDREELSAANRRLSGTEGFLLGRGSLLGHYVVGRLATGLGVRVWLTPSPLEGVTASVLLPGRLLATSEDTPMLVGNTPAGEWSGGAW